MRDPYLLGAGDAIGLAEQLRRFWDPQACRVDAEPAADHPVVWVVGLEEERLTRGKDAELVAAAGAARG
jgi:hypothetical protein